MNISVRAGARGNYVSALKLTSLNDTQSRQRLARGGVRNLRRHQAAAVQGARSAGGGGGGGLEWLSLALLAGVACLRRR